MDLRGIDIEEPEKQRRRWPLLLLVLLAAVVFGLYRFLPLASRETPGPQAGAPALPAVPARKAIAPPTPPPKPVAETPVQRRPAPPPLPLLDASDPLVRERVSGLTRLPELAHWLVNEGLVRRFVASVDNIAEGQSPLRHIGFMRPTSSFPVLARGDRVFFAPGAGGERYDTITNVFVSIDPDDLARLFLRLKPLVDTAWIELGYPNRDFDEALEAAFSMLLATPILEGPIELVPLPLTQAYADPELEELYPAQKQLLRMGPANQRRVQAKLRELAEALGMPVESFPPPSFYTPLTTTEVAKKAEMKERAEARRNASAAAEADADREHGAAASH